MIPVYQTIFGEDGNCFAAALASILEVPLRDIPSGLKFYDEYCDWLFTQGMSLKTRRFSTIDPPKNEYVIIGGESPRGYARGHAVVGWNSLIVHDPHPSNAGVTEMKDWSQIIKIGEHP